MMTMHEDPSFWDRIRRSGANRSSRQVATGRRKQMVINWRFAFNADFGVRSVQGFCKDDEVAIRMNVAGRRLQGASKRATLSQIAAGSVRRSACCRAAL
jgi:hypothetical protein